MTFLLIMICIFLYLLPTFNAAHRRHRNSSLIFIGNLLFGWTIIGWFLLLVWSNSKDIRDEKLKMPKKSMFVVDSDIVYDVRKGNNQSGAHGRASVSVNNSLSPSCKDRNQCQCTNKGCSPVSTDA